MSDSMLIVGAGYTGTRLARRAAEEGWSVTVTTRKAATRAELEDVARVLLWDAADDGASALAPALTPDTTVVYSVPTLFKDVPPGREHLRLPRAVLDAARDAHASRFIYLSSTSVYGDHGGEWVDEDSERRPDTPLGEMRRDIEDLVLQWAEPPTCSVVRIAGIYGPGRSLRDYAASGWYQVVDEDKVTNRIHVDDLVSIILATAERGAHQRAYLACDASPVRIGDLLDFLVERGMQRPPSTTMDDYERRRGPSAAARWRTTVRCNNARTLDELGLTLAYPDVFAFYR